MLSTFQDGDVDKHTHSLDEIKAAINRLQLEHSAKGRKLSGRVLHVCHYLPVICSLPERQPLTPPRTPDHTSDPGLSQYHSTTSEPPKWSLTHRQGHSAMISGIRSLSETHEQILVGWTGDIETSVPGESIPISSLSDYDKSTLDVAIEGYKEEEETRPLQYKAVWLSDNVAHGHYEGYCKNSETMSLT